MSYGSAFAAGFCELFILLRMGQEEWVQLQMQRDGLANLLRSLQSYCPKYCGPGFLDVSHPFAFAPIIIIFKLKKKK